MTRGDTDLVLEALNNEFRDGEDFTLGWVTDGAGRHRDDEAFVTFGDVEIQVSGDGAYSVAEFLVLACNQAREEAREREDDRNAVRRASPLAPSEEG